MRAWVGRGRALKGNPVQGAEEEEEEEEEVRRGGGGW